MTAPPTVQRGTCETCGYTITPDQSICPECGKPIDWERQRSLKPSPRPESAIATGIACLLAALLTWVSGAVCTVQPGVLAIGILAVVALQALIIAGFGALIRAADDGRKPMAMWWIALTPIWVASLVSVAPFHIIDWIIRGGAPAPPDAQFGIGIALLCIVINAFTILSAAATGGVLWGLLLLQKRLRRWPTWRSVWWAIGIPCVLLVALAFVNASAVAGAAALLIFPIALPAVTGLIAAALAVPDGARGAGMGNMGHAVQPTVVLAILLSAIACALFNFWWIKTCMEATL